MKGHTRTLLSLILAAVAPLALAQNAELSLSDAYMLKVPDVDYQGKPGFYQQAIFKSQPGGDWKLQSFDTALPLRSISKVDVTTTNEVPAQVLLTLTGGIGGCETLGDAVTGRNGNAFTVYAYYSSAYLHLPPDIACVAAVWAFQKVVPLPVYGLKAGTYSYSVNGKFNGTFTLNTDNVIALPLLTTSTVIANP